MADVIVGKSGKDQLTVLEDNTQIYGLAGNDTLKSVDKKEVLLIGGSGDDVLQITGGNGTLSGGKGKDTFELNYSATKKVSAVIEDIDPTNDKIIVTYDSGTLPQLKYKISGDDVIWTDDKGYFNLTLKGTNDASDYYEGNANEYIWDILRITNQERENQKLPPLTLSQGLMDAASIRADEQIVQYGHTRPDGTSCFTAVQKSYWSMGENVAAGQTSPDNVMTSWMNSTGHRANILNSGYKKIGVGYAYNANSNYKYHWVQMFGGGLTNPDTLSTSKILTTSITKRNGKLQSDDSPSFNTVIESNNTNIRRGGIYTIAKGFSGAIRINTKEAVTIDATNSGSLKNVQVLVYADTAELTIKNMTVANDSGSVIVFGTGTSNKLTIEGKNVLKTTDTWAAVVNVGGGLTINGKGSLDVTAGKQGPGIGYNSYADTKANIVINGCTITATTDMGAGIGSGASGSIGNITINGGNVKATSTWGAEFGAGYKGSTGSVTKNNNYTEVDSTTLILTNSTSSPVTISSAVKTVDASSRTTAVKITGNSNANSIVGGKGADTLWGSSGNDTLTGGNGNDIFIYSSGKDIITDYASGDKISLGAAVSKTTLSGSNVVFTIGSGSLTVKNGKGKTLSMIDKAGKAYTTIVGGSTASTLMTVTNSTKSPVTIGSEIKTVDASSRTTAVKITGNALANSILCGSKNDSIYGGAGDDSILGNGGNDKLHGEAGNDKIYGGAGSDTLTGGTGNDSLWGEAGSDTFIYASGEGKDVIFGFETGDLLQITGTFSGTYNSSKKEIAIKVGTTSNAIILKEFSATSFNINGNKYVISGTNLIRK